MKNNGDPGKSYPTRPTASTDNTLLDLHNSSQDTQPHSLKLIYLPWIPLKSKIIQKCSHHVWALFDTKEKVCFIKF